MTPRRILVVEDEPAIRGLVASYLEGQGYEVAQASTGEQARALVEDGKSLDLVIADLMLPDVGGAVFAHWLKKASPETKVLFVTGHSVETAQDHGLPADAPNLLLKPFGPGDVVKKVAELLG